MKVGILALQGGVREHARILVKLGAEPIKVKSQEDLTDINALIIPGGESTTIGILIKKYNLDKAIKEKHKHGMPIYGTCAGAIVLAKDIIKSKQPLLGLADISIKRNDYGRQIDSFETELSIKDIGSFNGVFIRAPTIKRFYDGVEILSEFRNNPVMIKQHNLLITTFHPELTDDTRIHEYFLNMAQEYKQVRDMQGDIEKTHTFKY
ncbi:MAG: pyridoxal 5'-phosphate synthase glutaminase subunit PdxT [Candidatus Woesearchaeota archaeon]|jgi:5'-phosphate synthase pdxT subunit|nr:pyridoxal 5'-phosphate synthase glutaminase subunit PdxT [Candidatus Woesearchaeota archaeon]MDP6600081.1 pyridoxal 5'-phosphate synthase glutaminase subunit PdxT [Candidatus Woesearchaeota archaeon]|tara:strand:+ start:2494 stop:3114 length:621 start_codon:yes stop_codon:yes gene_type:complete